MILGQREPKGLERAFCDTCQGNYTVAKGRCTGCIMREENRKQGVVYVAVGGVIAFFGATGFFMFGISLLGIICVIAGFMGLSFAARGLKAVLLGRNAE